MKTLFPVIVLLSVFVAGCATHPPFVPVSDSDQRVQYNGFSVLPPKGDGWHWVGREGQDKSTFFNTTYAKGEGVRTYLAHASLQDTEGKTYTPDEIISEVIGKQNLYKQGPRQKDLVLNTKTDHSLGIPCIRFDLTAIDPNVPNRPGELFKLDAHGFYCSHPDTDGVLMNIVYTRRAPEDEPYIGSADEGERTR